MSKAVHKLSMPTGSPVTVHSPRLYFSCCLGMFFGLFFPCLFLMAPPCWSGERSSDPDRSYDERGWGMRLSSRTAYQVHQGPGNSGSTVTPPQHRKSMPIRAPAL